MGHASRPARSTEHRRAYNGGMPESDLQFAVRVAREAAQVLRGVAIDAAKEAANTIDGALDLLLRAEAEAIPVPPPDARTLLLFRQWLEAQKQSGDGAGAQGTGTSTGTLPAGGTAGVAASNSVEGSGAQIDPRLRAATEKSPEDFKRNVFRT